MHPRTDENPAEMVAMMDTVIGFCCVVALLALSVASLVFAYSTGSWRAAIPGGLVIALWIAGRIYARRRLSADEHAAEWMRREG